MAGAWNLFSIGRKHRAEDQLTEMLVWLVDAVPEVGDALVRLAFGDPAIDGGFDVTTQHGIATGRLDALFVGPTFALIVESKIDSGFGPDQIRRYLDWLDEAHANRRHRGLMTLTAHPASWRPDDVTRAQELGVTRSERRWEQLHELLGPIADGGSGDELESRLVREFLEMLGEEGLIPMRPIEFTELQAWSSAYETVRRFHDFLFSCRDAIGKTLGARASSKSTDEGYVWQDFIRDDGCKIVVGLNCTDSSRMPRSAARQTPILWMAVEASHWPDWAAAKDRLDASPPAGWTSWKRWGFGDRPQVFRHLEDVILTGSIEQQRQKVADACAAAVLWLQAAEHAEHPVGDVKAGVDTELSV